MGYKKYWAAIAAAGMIGAMSLGSVFTSYGADGWSKSNDSWTYIYNGQTHTGWLQTSEGWYYMDSVSYTHLDVYKRQPRKGTTPLWWQSAEILMTPRPA